MEDSCRMGDLVFDRVRRASRKGVAEEKNRLEEKRVAAVDPAVAVPPLFFSRMDNMPSGLTGPAGSFR